MISVEKHGEMRQGTKSGSEFKLKKRRRKSVFRCIAASVPRIEISFSLSPTKTTRSRGLNLNYFRMAHSTESEYLTGNIEYISILPNKKFIIMMEKK